MEKEFKGGKSGKKIHCQESDPEPGLNIKKSNLGIPVAMRKVPYHTQNIPFQI